MPDKTREMHTLLTDWRARTAAPMPTPNDPAKPAEAPKKAGKKKAKKKAEDAS